MHFHPFPPCQGSSSRATSSEQQLLDHTLLFPTRARCPPLPSSHYTHHLVWSLGFIWRVGALDCEHLFLTLTHSEHMSIDGWANFEEPLPLDGGQSETQCLEPGLCPALVPAETSHRTSESGDSSSDLSSASDSLDNLRASVSHL